MVLRYYLSNFVGGAFNARKPNMDKGEHLTNIQMSKNPSFVWSQTEHSLSHSAHANANSGEWST